MVPKETGALGIGRRSDLSLNRRARGEIGYAIGLAKPPRPTVIRQTVLGQGRHAPAAAADRLRWSRLPARCGPAPAHRRGRRRPAPFRSVARPAAPRCRCRAAGAMTSSTRSTSTGDSPADGSSSINRRGRRTRPCATASICCWPPRQRAAALVALLGDFRKERQAPPRPAPRVRRAAGRKPRAADCR